MRIDFYPYALVCTDAVDIYDVHFIIIDEHEKTIDCSDQHGFSIANIHYQECKEVEILKYDKNERLNGDFEIIVQNGQLIYNKGDD